ncbi:hypothetical protein ACHQM5_029461 [Ranunculus cassubicifolius]
MAGMLPGVECARRRRCHQGGWMDSQSLISQGRTRRFCLYSSNHDTHLSSYSPQQRNAGNQSLQEDTLDGAARVAKQRLDERLRFQKKSESKSCNGKGSMDTDTSDLVVFGLHTEVYGTKKGRFSWGKKLGRKASDEDECAVCLERFKGGQTLVHLPCSHRFHSRCIVPWLANNTQCPCCRTDVIQ